MATEFCEKCGQMHEQPFSDEILSIYTDIRKAESEADRAGLLMVLADQFAEDLDETDEGLPEDAQSLADNFAKARLVYQSAGLKLGRAVLRGLNTYDAQEKARMVKAGKTVTTN